MCCVTCARYLGLDNTKHRSTIIGITSTSAGFAHCFVLLATYTAFREVQADWCQTTRCVPASKHHKVVFTFCFPATAAQCTQNRQYCGSVRSLQRKLHINAGISWSDKSCVPLQSRSCVKNENAIFIIQENLTLNYFCAPSTNHFFPLTTSGTVLCFSCPTNTNDSLVNTNRGAEERYLLGAARDYQWLEEHIPPRSDPRHRRHLPVLPWVWAGRLWDPHVPVGSLLERRCAEMRRRWEEALKALQRVYESYLTCQTLSEPLLQVNYWSDCIMFSNLQHSSLNI